MLSVIITKNSKYLFLCSSALFLESYCYRIYLLSKLYKNIPAGHKTYIECIQDAQIISKRSCERLMHVQFMPPLQVVLILTKFTIRNSNKTTEFQLNCQFIALSSCLHERQGNFCHAFICRFLQPYVCDMQTYVDMFSVPPFCA